MLRKYIPWSLRGLGPFLNTYGDPLFFRAIRRTPPIKTNPDAATSVHSIVGHRFVYAYLVAVKSFLRFHADIAVVVHDDGTLGPRDRQLMETHIPGVHILDRAEAGKQLDAGMNDPFLARVRNSYSSYLKLFDPTFLGNTERIMLLDTDTLFLRRPDAVIDWVQHGGPPWYHVAPRGNMKKTKGDKNARKSQDKHIQTLIMKELDDINRELNQSYRIEQGFCAGFVGYDAGTVDFSELKALLEVLYARFSDRIFRWGAEQTIHGLILCSKGAQALPIEDYFVFTQHNAERVEHAIFVHFVGENRFYRMHYPRLAAAVVQDLRSNPRGM